MIDTQYIKTYIKVTDNLERHVAILFNHTPPEDFTVIYLTTP